jgi:acetyl/propionyl-CoA carboxylase alpha subunit
VEESPSPFVDDDEEFRQRLGSVAVRAAQAVNYTNAGTIEFLVDKDQSFYFLEMNTRLQVEHPVTEWVTGIDIVKEQIRISRGRPLRYNQEDIHPHGWAIESRINAEDPLAGFAPSPGKLTRYQPPAGFGVRVDSGVYEGYTIPPFYDSLIAKLVTWGRDRDEAVARMRRALFEYVIAGSGTNLAFHRAVMENARFLRGELDTHFVEKETGLLDDTRAIIERDDTLARRLPAAGREKLRVVAAVAAATAAATLLQKGTPS